MGSDNLPLFLYLENNFHPFIIECDSGYRSSIFICILYICICILYICIYVYICIYIYMAFIMLRHTP